MQQPGFFDLGRRYESLDARPDPLVAINRMVPWESFRARLRATISFGLEPLEQPAGGAALGFRKQALGPEPDFQRLLKGAQSRRRLFVSPVNRLGGQRPAVLAHCRTR